MADELAPLEWNPDPSSAAPEEATAVDPRADVTAYWPLPALAVYGLPERSAALDCEVVGSNGGCSAGRLLGFDPMQRTALVQLPGARSAAVPLRFDQFRSLTLLPPLALAPPPDAGADAALAAVAQPTRTPYEVTLRDGATLRGETLGHVQRPFGLFLFPPTGEPGRVSRVFVPRAAYARAAFGERIGDVLVSQSAASTLEVEVAASVQQQLRTRRIGDILVARRIVTPQQLLEALDRQASMPLLRLGEVLTSLGMVSEADLQKALDQQRQDRGVALGELLVRMGFVTPENLQVALSRKMGYPLVDVDAFPAEVEALRRLPHAQAARLRVLPLIDRDGRLVVAIEDPARRTIALDEVAFSTQAKVVPVLAQTRSMADAIAAAYRRIGADGDPSTPGPLDAAQMPMPFGDDGTERLVESLEKEGLAVGGDADEAPIEQSDNSLVRLINSVIVEAHRQGASDIHIESQPGREKIRIRFRRDGRLHTHLELPPSFRQAIVARIKIMCDLDIAERRKPQDGKIAFARFSPQHRIELRVATIPTHSGLEDVAMRLLASSTPIPLDRLGLSAWNLERLRDVIERPYGMVLCVGPTGSGKTTTLHSALGHVNRDDRKIWTAEDPIEITQPGLRQVQMNPKIDWTFAKALRAFLRADPDVIMVGEIRDAETAQMAIEASLTGHLVMSTLHTNSAPETVTRLLDMGMDPFSFADSLLAVLAQRLVRRLCPACRVAREALPDERDELLADYLHAFDAAAADAPPIERDALLADWTRRHGRDGRLMLHRPGGCDACDGTGWRGRTALHELLVVSREIRRLVQTGAPAERLQAAAARDGMRTLRQDGIDKVWAGLTTLTEVRANTAGAAPQRREGGAATLPADWPPLPAAAC